MPLYMMNCNNFTPLAVRHGRLPHRHRLTGLTTPVRKYLQIICPSGGAEFGNGAMSVYAKSLR